MNVMLTRCQRGMVVVTNRDFLRGPGHDTLLGRLARHWEDERGSTITWTDALALANRTADMPGVAARPHQSMPPTLSVPGPAAPRPAVSDAALASLADRVRGLSGGTATAAHAPRAPGAATVPERE
ncbi:hypothetical protein B0H21DRAFT_200502 [Amylocystis lapponica]|nr:hypothetical protein B0H21DRAFT_200502 [Amylocystis lapponica]